MDRILQVAMGPATGPVGFLFTCQKLRRISELELEAPPGFEPGMEVLQTSALPLGDGAGRNYELCRKTPAASRPGGDSARRNQGSASCRTWATFALACQPKLTHQLASGSEGWSGK